jgi:signal transduction histidine kinase
LIESRLSAITDSTRYVDALNRLAMLLYEQNPDSTAFYADKAGEIANRTGYMQGRADAMNNKGVSADVKGDIQTALRYYQEANGQYRALRDSPNIVQTLMNMAMVYSEAGNPEKAKEQFRLAFNLGSRLSHDSIVSILIYNYLLEYSGEFSKAAGDSLIAKAIRIAKGYHDIRLLLAIDQLKANKLVGEGFRDSGVALMEHSVAAGRANGLLYMTIDILLELGDWFAATDPVRAAAYYRQALAVTEENKYMSYEERVARRLFNLYAARRDTASAFFYSQKLLKALQDKQDADRRQGFDYIDFAVKDQQLSLAEQRSAYSARIAWLTGIACILAVAMILLLWRNARRNKRNHYLLQQQYAELGAVSSSLESRNRQYQRLLKVVAHDLRNPIGAVVSASDVMLHGSKQEQPMVKLIRQAGTQCLQMIGELLEADLEFRPESLRREPVEVGELLRQVAALLEFKVQEKRQSLVVDVATAAVVSMDREQMRRVIDNLTVNAIKFSPSGASITLSAKEDGGEVILAVSDEGIGIPAEIAHQLFEPFTVAKRKGTEGEPTFGLGLSICKQIVEAHGGSIGFESREREGTVFYVRLAGMQ